jgi:hypothetical protein
MAAVEAPPPPCAAAEPPLAQERGPLDATAGAEPARDAPDGRPAPGQLAAALDGTYQRVNARRAGAPARRRGNGAPRWAGVSRRLAPAPPGAPGRGLTPLRLPLSLCACAAAVLPAAAAQTRTPASTATCALSKRATR